MTGYYIRATAEEGTPFLTITGVCMTCGATVHQRRVDIERDGLELAVTWGMEDALQMRTHLAGHMTSEADDACS